MSAQTNRIWYLNAPGKVSLVEEPVPSLEDDQVLVDVEACGICQVDWIKGMVVMR